MFTRSRFHEKLRFMRGEPIFGDKIKHRPLCANTVKKHCLSHLWARFSFDKFLQTFSETVLSFQLLSMKMG